MLNVHENVVRLVGFVMPMVGRIERVDPDLARQMRRAVMSVPLNIAEGANQAGKRREFHYRVALGSARETHSAVRVAQAAGYIEAPAWEVTNEFNTVIGSLHRCVFKKAS